MKTSHQPHIPNRREKGFTLIEVMVAMGIFAIGILAVASMEITASHNNRSARLRTEAFTLASERIETLITREYASIADGSETGVEIDLLWTVTDDTPIANTKTITVTASWDDRGGTRSDDFRYIIADPG